MLAQIERIHLSQGIILTSVKVICQVTCPGREGNWFTRATKDSKSGKEYHNLSTAVKGSGDEVIPLDEPFGSVTSQIELTKEADHVVAGDGRIQTDEKFSKIPQDDGSIKVWPNSLAGEEFVHDIEGHRGNEADQERCGDPLIDGAKGEHFGGNRPRNGKSVELLNLGTGPDVGTFSRLEDGCLILDDTKNTIRLRKWTKTLKPGWPTWSSSHSWEVHP